MRKKIEIVAHATIQLILVLVIALMIAPGKKADAQFCLSSPCGFSGGDCPVIAHSCSYGPCYCPEQYDCCAGSYGLCPETGQGCYFKECCDPFSGSFCDMTFGGCINGPAAPSTTQGRK
jgi:hypothetical protein